jgi:hypothetical protein
MPHQLDFVTDTPRARNTDPETSHLAAAALKASGNLGFQQQQVLEAVRKYPGKTAVELSAITGFDRYLVSRRLPELVPVYVRRGQPRACTVNGRPQGTWHPVRR